VAEYNWAASWPGSGNSWFITTMDNEDVLFTFNTNTVGDGCVPDGYWPHSSATRAGSYVIVGDLGDELGGDDWNPGGTLVMTDDGLNGDEIAGDGVYTFSAAISATGTYQWKVACNGGWGEQFGSDAPGINSATWYIDVLELGVLVFTLDTNTARLCWDYEDPVASEETNWSGVKSSY
jgi:hypothetical protein